MTGTIVSADIDNVYDGLPELLPLIDIMIGSKEFAGRVTGIADPRKALVELKSRYGCALVGMTIGAAGAVVYHEGTFIESPGFAAPGGCRDTTGAGDAFHSGFLYGFLTGEDLETSLKLGNAVAAIKCSALGARTALPTKSELDQFLSTVQS
jgi:sugar/nucleoside kinase (ribokinase family)